MTDSAGDFPYTIDLYQPADDSVDAFGHKVKSWSSVAQCAARVWQTSTAETSRDAAEFPVRAPRLLLREPIDGVEVGWRLMWRGRLWQLISTEERAFDLLVSLEPVAD